MVASDAQPDPSAAPSAPPAPPPPRTFNAFLLNVDDGRLHAELSDAVLDCVQAAQAQGKASAITLQLRFKPTKSGQFEVFDDVRVRTPAGERRPSLFFPDDDGSLHRSDPHQPKLPFREAPAMAAPREVREAPIRTTTPPADAGGS